MKPASTNRTQAKSKSYSWLKPFNFQVFFNAIIVINMATLTLYYWGLTKTFAHAEVTKLMLSLNNWICNKYILFHILDIWDNYSHFKTRSISDHIQVFFDTQYYSFPGILDLCRPLPRKICIFYLVNSIKIIGRCILYGRVLFGRICIIQFYSSYIKIYVQNNANKPLSLVI